MAFFYLVVLAKAGLKAAAKHTKQAHRRVPPFFELRPPILSVWPSPEEVSDAAGLERSNDHVRLLDPALIKEFPHIGPPNGD